MFDHVTIRASDRQASERFYEVVLLTLGIEQTYSDEHFAEWDDFSLGPASEEKAAHDPAPHRLRRPPREHVDEFWHVGTAAGFRDDGPPGPRPQYRDNGAPGERPVYHDGYYSAFVLDPDGNNIEVVSHNRR